MTDDEEDVPIRLDFRDPAVARTWIEETRIKRPFRPNFFAAFCEALSSQPRMRSKSRSKSRLLSDECVTQLSCR